MIPKTIFQTNRDDNFSENTQKAIQSWRELNPDYQYEFFDDNRCRDYLGKHFSPDTLKAFDKVKPGPFKADLWRYCVLYQEGGIYADLDTVCLKPLDQVLSPDDQFVVPKDPVPTGLYNAFIATIPKHPFLEMAIQMTIRNILTESYTWTPLGITGPVLLGNAVMKCLNRADAWWYLRPGDWSFKKDSSIFKYRILPINFLKLEIYQGADPIILMKYRHCLMSDLSKPSHYFYRWMLSDVFNSDKIADSSSDKIADSSSDKIADSSSDKIKDEPSDNFVNQ